MSQKSLADIISKIWKGLCAVEQKLVIKNAWCLSVQGSVVRIIVIMQAMMGAVIMEAGLIFNCHSIVLANVFVSNKI